MHDPAVAALPLAATDDPEPSATEDAAHRSPGVSTRRQADAKAKSFEAYEAIPASARRLVVLLWIAVALATITASLNGFERGTWWTFFALTAAAAAAQLFGVRATHNQSYHLAITFVVAGALLLPPQLLVLLCIGQHAAEWFKERYPLEIQAFNIANYTLAGLAASAAADFFLGPRELAVDSRTAAAGLVAGAAFVLVNHAFLAGMLRVARGHSLRQSGLFSFESLSTDLVLAAVGSGLATWWSASVWFVPFAVAPLVLIRRALSVPHLRAQATLDAKTGLYNAAHLNEALVDEVARASRFDRPLSVIIADLDLLREINNQHGHLLGDAVLRGVAEVFREHIRTYDVAARFGGEEFAIVLPEMRLGDALEVAERIRAAVETTLFRGRGADEPVKATISLGVASFPLHGSDSHELMHQADLALYRAKDLGRNRVCAASAETGGGGPETPLRTTVAEAPAAIGAAGQRIEPRPVVYESARASIRALGTRMRVARAQEAPTPDAAHVSRNSWIVIAPLLAGALALLAFNAQHLADGLMNDPRGMLGFALVVVALQVLAVDLYGSGAESGSAIGILAGGFVFGLPAAIMLAMLAALVQWTRRRAPFDHGIFDLSNFTLAAAAAAYIYETVGHEDHSVTVRLAAALAAAIAYRVVNSGLLCLVMSFAEGRGFRAVWGERFRWASPHYVAHAPLAFAFALAYEKLGLIGLTAFAVPPVLATLSVRQYLGHTRASVEEVRRTNDELRRSYADLEESNQRVRRTHLATIAALSRSMEAKDTYTGGHTERVAALAVGIARRLGYRGDDLEAIEIGALLHDIGKIGIPEAVLNKAGPLGEEEWKSIREHPLISDYILSDVDLHPFVRQIVRWSHERLDGAGYPDGLSGDEIPLAARIVLVADAFDALTSDRSYRPSRSAAAALEELGAHVGTQFCPLSVEALTQLWSEEPELLAARPQALDALSAVA